MDFENSLRINNGIYTMPEVGKILRIPYYKVNKWVNHYWDKELGSPFESRYSWSVGNSKAISFHTLIEFYVLHLLGEAGIATRKVLNAHLELSETYSTPFPFAKKQILEGIRTDGKWLFLENEEGIITLDGKKQFNLEFVKVFFKNLDFDNDLLATKFWPLGKEKNIIVDPQRQFGHPVLGSTNIYPETIYSLIKAGEPIDFIAFTYEIEPQLIKDAIEYCSAA